MRDTPGPTAGDDATPVMPAPVAEVYERLRALARRQRRIVGGAATLDTTALVHEVWLELERARPHAMAPQDYYGYAAQAMRNLLIDHARRRARPKHGGDLRRVDLGDDEGLALPGLAPEQLLDLDAALVELEREDPRAARVVMLHYFAGLAFEQIAELVGVSARTLKRDWRFARAWLHQRLEPPT